MTPPPPARRPVHLAVLAALFFGSGCAAMIYEVIWFQLLQHVIGSSAVSLGLLLGTFMGGMSLGGLFFPRVASARRHPLRVYALLELGTAVFAVAVLLGVPLIDRLYAGAGVGGTAGLLLRGLVCAACLLPPAVLMGATLPAAARWFESTPRGASDLGLVYAGNIAGAVAGCVLAGFYLLRVHDIGVATAAAAATNAAAAAAAYALARFAPYRGPESPPGPTATAESPAPAEPAGAPGAGSRWPVHLAVALSGFGALGAEVVWTRLLSLMLGATVYAFSIILAVFLVGLGVGSGVGAVLAGRTARPAAGLAWCQALLVLAVGWAGYELTVLPYWPIDPRLAPDPWVGFQLDVVRCVWAVLPAACCWGASFPFALAAATVPGRDPGRTAGAIYAANTAGAVAGAVGFGVFGVGLLGTRLAQVVLAGVAGAAAGFAVLPARGRKWKLMTVAAAATFGGAAGWAAVPDTPWELIAWGREVPFARRDPVAPLFVGEGANSSVAVTERPNGERIFHVSGRPEASTAPQDMRVQRMLGHLPALVHPRPRTALVVGCGAGVTAGSLLTHPSVERVVVCEIEPLVPARVAPLFAAVNHDLVRDPRVEFVTDDARHYVLTTRETFDVITTDPIHPWLKGAAALYTAEYLEAVKRRLNPGGVVAQWVPLYESAPEVLRSELATFFEAFPHGTVWANTWMGTGYDVVLLGQDGPTRIDVQGLARRVDSPDHAAVAASVTGVGFGWLVDLLGTYAGRAGDLGPWLRGAEINRDRNLRLQYTAGLRSTAAGQAASYDALKAHRRYPDDLFLVPDEVKPAFRLRLGFPDGAPDAAGPE